MKSILTVCIVFLLMILLSFSDKKESHICHQDFDHFILIEYDSSRMEFELISDMLDKSYCMDSIINIGCLTERPIKKNRVEKITLKINQND